MSAAVEVKNVIKITKEGFETMGEALGLFNRTLDNVVPWSTYKITCKKFDLYREYYSDESAQLVGEIVTQMTNAQDNYANATQVILEWCGLTTKLLSIYVDQFANKKAPATYQAQRNFFITVLNDGLMKMSAGKAKLDQAYVNFHDVADKLTALHNRLTEEFDEKSSFFQAKVEKIRMEASKTQATAATVDTKLIPELRRQLAKTMNFFDGFKASIERTNLDLSGIKAKLEYDDQNLVAVKNAAEATEMVILAEDQDEFRHGVEQYVYILIAQCKEYEKRHERD